MSLKRFCFSFLLIIIVITLYIYSHQNDSKIVEESLVNYDIDSSYNELICKNILIIEKINLQKCMNESNVDKDIVVLFDDKTIVLAGHSGNASNAYFKDLYKLDVSDKVVFYHNHEKNEYYVKKMETKKKKDKLKFENIENQLILVTCSYTKKDEQIVYFLQK